jgi:hypothetical protein
MSAAPEVVELSLDGLKVRWRELGQGEPPRLPRRLLARLYVQLLEEQAYGGLLDDVIRELEAVAERVAGNAKATAPQPPAPRQVMLSTGTRLVREWNGRTISVEMRDEGYVWEDRTYRSLSEIAREVTGTRWSGPRFFGIAGRG